MNNLNAEERELIKLMKYFSKKAAQLVEAGILSDEHEQVSSACTNLTEQLYSHAEQREQILEKRELLKKVVQDNASCPQCHKNTMLKHVGTDTNDNGWHVNVYKCRKCNIHFNWNRPNNPWDMVKFLEAYASELEQAKTMQELPEDQLAQMNTVTEQLYDNINKLKPVLEGSDAEYDALIMKDKEMEKLIKQFKTYLAIEKIKMEAAEQEADYTE